MTDTGLTIFAFLSDLQVPTKRLSEGCLDLVRQLRLPEYLMANTNAKQVANDMKRSAPDETTRPVQMVQDVLVGYCVESAQTRHSNSFS